MKQDVFIASNVGTHSSIIACGLRWHKRIPALGIAPQDEHVVQEWKTCRYISWYIYSTFGTGGMVIVC